MNDTNIKTLSVVVANYNYGRFLETALNSVLSQKPAEAELIVVDGGSTDNSLEIIRHHALELAWWVSEKDKGQSNAFNKGFAHAKGRYLTWLNADDVMFPGAIDRILKAIRQNPSCEWFAGGCCWLDQDLRVLKCSRGRRFSKIRADAGDIQVYAPSSVFAKTLYDRVGGFIDENCNYVMDIELWNRFYRLGNATYQPLPGYNWGLRLHPEAKMSGHNFSQSPTSNPNHPIHAMKVSEYQNVLSKYATSKMSSLKYVLSLSPVESIQGRIDTLRYRGRHYREVEND